MFWTLLSDEGLRQLPTSENLSQNIHFVMQSGNKNIQQRHSFSKLFSYITI